MQSAFISEQGRRSFMEDRHVLLPDFMDRDRIFGGIYDGHCGSSAAEYAARHLHQRFQDSLRQGSTPEQGFSRAYQAIASELKDEQSGSTAVTFLLQRDTITAANVGDSRALVIQEGGTLQLTADHRVDNEDERKRLQHLGSRIEYPYVMAGFRGLMPTRTLGDAEFRAAGIIAEPFVRTYSIAKGDLFLLVACDGLFDVLDNEEVADFGRRAHNPQDLLQRLQEEVLIMRLGMDNLTIIACDLRDSVSGIR